MQSKKVLTLTSRKKPVRVQKQNHHQWDNEEFNRLLQITGRCVDYYNKFVEEKDHEVDVVMSAFVQLQNKLNIAFKSIMEEVHKKQQHIKQFLQKQQSHLLQLKHQQEQSLKQHLHQVKSTHLNNLLESTQDLNLPDNLPFQLRNFASTLHNFYRTIEEIEEMHYRDCVDESINFINNLICEEMKNIVLEIIPQKSLNCSLCLDDSTDQIRETIGRQQQQRKQQIAKYKRIIAQ